MSITETGAGIIGVGGMIAIGIGITGMIEMNDMIMLNDVIEMDGTTMPMKIGTGMIIMAITEIGMIINLLIKEEEFTN
jgi:hypothetical protein